MANRFRVTSIAWIALGLSLGGCAQDIRDRYETYGLKTVEIEVSPDFASQVYHGGKEKNLVSAELNIEDQSIGGYISLSGQGSITDIKKSYSFESSEDPKGIRFKNIKLAAQSQDPSFLRTLFGYRVFNALGIPTPEVEPISLYLNGQFQGLYLLIERVDEDFYKRRHLSASRVYRSKVLKSDFGVDMLSDPESGLEVELGRFQRQEIQRLVDWATQARSSDRDPSATDPFAETHFDTQQMLNFFAANLFLGNCDGFDNNLYLYVSDDDPRFRFTPWDWERSYEGACTLNELLSKNHLLRKLLEYPDYRQQLKEVLTDLTGQEFPITTFEAILNEEWNKIERAYLADRHLGNGRYIYLDQRSKVRQNYLDFINYIAVYISS